jgi:hypothetical protein
MNFTSAEITHIVDVKRIVELYLNGIRDSNWASEYILPWDKMYLSGGAIASIIQGETPKDFDFYFLDEFSMRKMETHLLYKNEYIKDVDEKYRDAVGKDGKMITEKAITMKNGASFIIMQWGEPADVKSSFDYVHCTAHYSLLESKLFISPKQYRACKNKLLIANSATSSHARANKFIKRGYVTPLEVTTFP